MLVINKSVGWIDPIAIPSIYWILIGNFISACWKPRWQEARVSRRYGEEIVRLRRKIPIEMAFTSCELDFLKPINVERSRFFLGSHFSFSFRVNILTRRGFYRWHGTHKHNYRWTNRNCAIAEYNQERGGRCNNNCDLKQWRSTEYLWIFATSPSVIKVTRKFLTLTTPSTSQIHQRNNATQTPRQAFWHKYCDRWSVLTADLLAFN